MGNITELEKLVELYKAGSITKPEFEKLKAEIINLSPDKETTENSTSHNSSFESIFKLAGYLSDNNVYVNPPEVANSLLHLTNNEIDKIQIFLVQKVKHLGSEKLKTHLTQDERDYIKKFMTKGFTNKHLTSEPKSAQSSNQKYLAALGFIVGILIAIFYPTPTQPVDNTSSSVSKSDKPTLTNLYKTDCTICGREFTGNGYEEVSDGVWKPCGEDISTSICSRACGMKHTAQMHEYMNGRFHNSPNGDGGYKMGNDGRVYENNSCSLCRGTGIEKGNPTWGISDRICPMCEGRGVRSY